VCGAEWRFDRLKRRSRLKVKQAVTFSYFVSHGRLALVYKKPQPQASNFPANRRSGKGLK
jgi:hypothetical protein